MQELSDEKDIENTQTNGRREPFLLGNHIKYK